MDMKSISQKLQDDIRAIMNGTINEAAAAGTVRTGTSSAMTTRVLHNDKEGNYLHMTHHNEEPGAVAFHGKVHGHKIKFESEGDDGMDPGKGDITRDLKDAHKELPAETHSLVKNIAHGGVKHLMGEANIKHPNQQAIDVHEPEKDEITAHDFKKLRAMKKDQHGKITKEDTDSQIQELTGMAAQQAAVAISLIKAGKKDGKMPKPMKEDSEQVEEEEKKKVVSPFDYKNYKSQIPKKPGETAGFDSKKISTGTVYSRKPVKEESHQSKTTMKHIPNASPAMKKAAKDIKPGVAGYRDRIDMLKAGGVKEETQIDELSKSTLGSYLTKKTDEYMKGKTQPGSKEHAKDVQNMGKAYDKLKKEEAELDEAYQTAKSEFVARQGRLTAAAAETEKDPARLKRMSNIPGYSAAMDLAKKTTQGAKHTKEATEYTFAEYLDAARAQYNDEDAVLVANEAFKNQDITLFADQSQSPEA